MAITHLSQDPPPLRRFFISGIKLWIVLLLIKSLSSGGSTFGASPETFEDLRRQFQTPSREYTQVPFWFWNGEIDEQGIRDQIASMEAKGVYGFVIHARMGLSKQVGYMTERWLQLVRHAVEEAERRGMVVYLYDEGMYPSGSAHGKVVQGRPDLASQGLEMTLETVTGPAEINLEGTLVAAVLLQSEGEGFKPGGRTFEAGERVTVPDGEWGLFRFLQHPSGGVIRGVHADEEDNQPGAPPSADLLSVEATQRFIAETHERYFQTIGSHFGKTVRGIFTDEPSILGRRAKRGLRPWSNHILEKISRRLDYDFTPYLPFLWVDAPGQLEEIIRSDFDSAIASILNETYYQPLSEWCAQHGIALTGHPAGGGDLDPQLYFQQPGQDVVWRWVLPGETATEGEQSLTGKTASSMALNLNRKTVINECFGAFGWRLTMREMKWLSDWLFVRGTNLLMPHAFYYSVEGERLFERPPDLAWNNLWWPHYQQFSGYTNRLSWLMRESTPVTGVAILAINGKAEWRVAKTLFESQLDFYYLPENLVDSARIEDGRLLIGQASYHTIILDDADIIRPRTGERLQRILAGGLRVIAFDSQLQPHPLNARGRTSTDASSPDQPSWGRTSAEVASAEETGWGRTSTEETSAEKTGWGRSSTAGNSRFEEVSGEAELVRILRRNKSDVHFDRPAPDIRFSHRTIGDHHFYFFTNEGLEPFSGLLTINQPQAPEEWDPESGRVRAIKDVTTAEGSVQFNLALSPAGSTIVAFPGNGDQLSPAGPSPGSEVAEVLELPTDGWKLSVADRRFEDVRLGSWNQLDGMESFSGTAWYEMTVQLDGNSIRIDLGKVAEYAEVELNGRSLGTRLWEPFLFEAEEEAVKGTNILRIGITNTRSNELTDEKLLSGLLGPVRVLIGTDPQDALAAGQN